MGLMLAEPGFHTRCWVEWEEYPRSVIVAAQRAGYFAPAPIWDDLTTFDAKPFAGCIDTLLAGYPCQPFSHAGQRKGTDDERHLWPDVARVARELGPSLEWLLLENVAGHVTLGLETVLRELWDMGFTPAVGLFAAAETGAPHERQRVFIVAHRQGPDGRSEQQAGRTRSGGTRPSGSGAELGNTNGGNDARGLDGRAAGREAEGSQASREGSRHTSDRKRLRAESGGAGDTMADTASTRREPARAGTSGECEGGQSLPRSGGGTMAGTGGARLEGRERSGASDKWLWSSPSESTAERGRPLLHPPGPTDMGRWADVLSVAPYLAPSLSISDVKRAADHFAQMVARGELAETQAQSFVRLCADGMANRSRSLRLLGNGVHPLTAAYAWRSLSSAHGLQHADGD